MNKKLIILNYAALVLSALFSVLQISFVWDISLTAFLLSAAFTAFLAWESLVQLFRRLNKKSLSRVYKLYQYLPFILLAAFTLRRAGKFGVSHAYDAATVLLWAAASLVSLILVFFLGPKRVLIQNPDFRQAWKDISEAKRTRIQKVLSEFFDWVDAFIQAIFTVALINIFIFQLYEIPSESMVPEFLVRDRVVGIKALSGPKFPLSDIGLPIFRSYKRGDIVIFRNPHYKKDRPAELKTFVSQFVYMISLTMVKMNVDEHGNLKADPLVKRITGVPGEQVLMQDGILYRRTREESNFTLVKDDALWAEWNLAGLPADVRQKVQYTPLSIEGYRRMLKIEKERQNLNYTEAALEAAELVRRFTAIKKSVSGLASAGSSVPEIVNINARHLEMFFMQSDNIIRKLLTVSGGELWFSVFMTDWTTAIPPSIAGNMRLAGGDIYSDAMFRQNLNIKLTFGRLAVRTGELVLQGLSAAIQNQDAEKIQFLQQFQDLVSYMLDINDMRNMPVFPPNTASGEAQYIPQDAFFMMGDNRFNSLDMRHSYVKKRVPITSLDNWTFYYDSNIEPQYVLNEDILGTPVLRFLPIRRFGVPGLTAKKSIN